MENSKKIINDRGFIKVTIIIVIALVLLKYVYDIDVIGKVYEAWLWLWSKYGDSLVTVWEWVKSKVGF